MRHALLLAVLLLPSASGAAAPPLRVVVDATEAGRHILHSRVTVPVSPGAVTLAYPKWIPGEHGPTGPIASLVGLRVAARGRPVAWRRDGDDPYLFHLEAPPGSQ